MDGLDELYLMEHPDSTEEIPVLDIAPFLRGEPGARERLGAQLKEISETVGFFYLEGHGVPLEKMDGILAASKRLHELPIETRRQFKRTDRVGYRAAEDREGLGGRQPILMSSFVTLRERPEGDPKTVWGDPFRMGNHWPDDLPGFRELAVDYYRTVEQVHYNLLPLWDTALGLPDGYLAKLFRDPYVALSLLHYPPQGEVEQLGLQPHTDSGFVSILAPGEVPGLIVRMPSGRWRVADVRPGAFMVNTGNIMVRLTNGRFLSTKHGVINNGGVARCSVPLFVGPDLDAMIEVVPTCQSPDNPAKYPPIRFEDYYRWFYYGGGVNEKSVGPDVKSEGRWVADRAIGE